MAQYLMDNRLDSDFLTTRFKQQQFVISGLDKPVPVFVIYSCIGIGNAGEFINHKDVYNLMRWGQDIQNATLNN